MPSKLQTYMQMADEAQRQITGSYRGWTGFLTTAARLYKYPYAEQVMIHAQRPDATACAEYDFWNEKMGRYVRRGSKGMVELRDCVQKLISEQMDGFISDETIRQTQTELNTLYDGFTAKYGLINSRAKLTPRMLNELVEKIEVYNAEKIDGEWVQRLRIHYNCVGEMNIPNEPALPIPAVTVNTRKGVFVSYTTDDRPAV